MTVTQGPWAGAPVVQVAEQQQRAEENKGRSGYAKPDHRPRADPCPPICHVCPLLKNPDGRFDVMPGCSNGSISNSLDNCVCDYDGPPIQGIGASCSMDPRHKEWEHHGDETHSS